MKNVSKCGKIRKLKREFIENQSKNCFINFRCLFFQHSTIRTNYQTLTEHRDPVRLIPANPFELLASVNIVHLQCIPFIIVHYPKWDTKWQWFRFGYYPIRRLLFTQRTVFGSFSHHIYIQLLLRVDHLPTMMTTMCIEIYFSIRSFMCSCLCAYVCVSVCVSVSVVLYVLYCRGCIENNGECF